MNLPAAGLRLAAAALSAALPVLAAEAADSRPDPASRAGARSSR